MLLHNVPTHLTPADKAALDIILQTVDFPSEVTARNELSLIRDIQTAVFTYDRRKKIPHGQPREPQDYLAHGGGLCYDRSRTLEKALRYQGFSVRHVSIYANPDNVSFLRILLQKGTPSHALTEVKTRLGWLALDPDVAWVAADDTGEVYAVREISSPAVRDALPQSLSLHIRRLYTEEKIVVYGLYSRHGKFYPPYNFIPDYNLRELMYNFGE